MSDEKPPGPSLRLLWRLTAVPAVLLALAVGLSIAFLLPWGPKVTDDRLGALWVLLASLIATVATLIGALLTASSTERAHRLEEDRQVRQEAVERSTEQQQRVDSTIQGIKLLEARPDDQIMTAGALAMVVRLGEREVALRMLGPALDGDDLVDAGTAAWVIDECLTAEHLGAAVRGYAARLLMVHAAQFPSDDFAGLFEWPPSVTSRWPAGLDANTGAILVLALADVLTSRPREWWTREGGGWDWVPDTISLALRKDPHGTAKAYAAWTLRLLYDPDDESWKGHWLGSDEARQAMAAWGENGLPASRQDRLTAWRRGENVALPTRAESALELAASLSDTPPTGGDVSPDTSPPEGA